ncbi:hypothetical protein KSP40_PGU019036 [Platanthera guangdongensis]|uniref:RING/U-box superfamily protein n=1 Tax=Platanthera guangdongensis TaxID=2320717 RepID=A0ABR2LP75_9ASPA
MGKGFAVQAGGNEIVRRLRFRRERRMRSSRTIERWEKKHSRSQSCPFCRDNLKRVSSSDLWIFTYSKDAVDMTTVYKENQRRLLLYIDKLPVIVPDTDFDSYDSHVK